MMCNSFEHTETHMKPVYKGSVSADIMDMVYPLGFAS